jgi:hypothetical protein
MSIASRSPQPVGTCSKNDYVPHLIQLQLDTFVGCILLLGKYSTQSLPQDDLRHHYLLSSPNWAIIPYQAFPIAMLYRHLPVYAELVRACRFQFNNSATTRKFWPSPDERRSQARQEVHAYARYMRQKEGPFWQPEICKYNSVKYLIGF